MSIPRTAQSDLAMPSRGRGQAADKRIPARGGSGLERVDGRETPSLSIVVISYNTRDMTLACVRSVFAETCGVAGGFEVLVLDNRSTDGSREAIAAAFPANQYPNLRLVDTDRNLGFAGGNNLAAEQARGEWLLLLNPDTVVLDGAIDKLVAFAEAMPAGGIFGGRTLFGDRTLNPASCWRHPSLWSMGCIAFGATSVFRRFGPLASVFDRESYGNWRRDTVREVDFVSGCFLLLRRSLWEALGGFDLSFFMYGEEADLCWRGKRLTGARCFITPAATIVHYGGASEKVRADTMVKLFVAKARLCGKHWSRGRARWGVRMLNVWASSRVAAFSILRRIQPSRQTSYETWRDIWQRRDEWRAAADAAIAERSSPKPISDTLLSTPI